MIYYDVDTDICIEVVVPYIKTHITKYLSPVDWHTAQFTHYVTGNNEQYLIYGIDDFFSITSEKPVFEGIEKNIVQMLGFNPDSFTVIDSKWITNVTQSANRKSRIAEYRLAEIVTRYESIYGITIPLDTIYRYTATATYKGVLKRTVADIEQEPNPPRAYVAEIVAASGGATLLFICVAFLVYHRNVIIYAVDTDGNKRRIRSMHVKKHNPLNIDCTRYSARLLDGENMEVVIKKRLARKVQGYDVEVVVGDLTQTTTIEGLADFNILVVNYKGEVS